MFSSAPQLACLTTHQDSYQIPKPRPVMDSDDDLTCRSWHITIPHDLPADLRPAYDFINTELALDPPFAVPVDRGWSDLTCTLYASNFGSLIDRKKSLRTIMQGLSGDLECSRRLSRSGRI
jgi:hypothetical protein